MLARALAGYMETASGRPLVFAFFVNEVPLDASGPQVTEATKRAGQLLGSLCDVVAVEPSIGLIQLLRRRLPRVHAIAGWAESLPVGDGWSQLTAACGALGPDAVVLRELARVTCEGGVIALINPEEPEWFEARGWEVNEVAPATVKPHDRWIDEFFGPPDPPRFLVTKMKER